MGRIRGKKNERAAYQAPGQSPEAEQRFKQQGGDGGEGREPVEIVDKQRQGAGKGGKGEKKTSLDRHADAGRQCLLRSFFSTLCRLGRR